TAYGGGRIPGSGPHASHRVSQSLMARRRTRSSVAMMVVLAAQVLQAARRARQANIDSHALTSAEHAPDQIFRIANIRLQHAEYMHGSRCEKPIGEHPMPHLKRPVITKNLISHQPPSHANCSQHYQYHQDHRCPGPQRERGQRYCFCQINSR
ncbi:MAG: hypothetical protein ACKVQU_19705, partial [Burkholderiales bacterium]